MYCFFCYPTRAYTNFVSDLALSILEKLIQTRWKILPREQALGKYFFASIDRELTSFQ